MSGESMEPMEEVPLVGLGESELERLYIYGSEFGNTTIKTVTLGFCTIGPVFQSYSN